MRGFIGGAVFGGVLILSMLYCMPVQVVQTAQADGYRFQDAQAWESQQTRSVEASRLSMAAACKRESVDRLIDMHRKAVQFQTVRETQMGQARCDAVFRWQHTRHSVSVGAAKAFAGELRERGYRYDQDSGKWEKQQAEKK